MAKFYKDEFACKHCGQNLTNEDFLAKLNRFGEKLLFPVIVSSGYRCPEHNQKVSKTGPKGPHTTGRAVDLAVRGEQAYIVLREALISGAFTGIGVNQKGESRFIHLDDLKDNRPAVWSY
jgi:zinc D-Ala-D-Ala carboxypeptidase